MKEGVFCITFVGNFFVSASYLFRTTLRGFQKISVSIIALIFHRTTFFCFRKISISIYSSAMGFQFPCSYSGVVIILSLLYFKTTSTSSSPASSCSTGKYFFISYLPLS